MIQHRKFEGAEAFAGMLHDLMGDVVQYGKPDSRLHGRKWKEWSCTSAALPSGAVMHFTSAGPIAGTGRTDSDKIVLLMPWMHKVPHFYRGIEMARKGAAIYGPMAEHVGKCDADHAFTVFIIEARRLRDYLGRVVGKIAEPAPGSFHPVDLTFKLRKELETVVADIVAMADREDCRFPDDEARLNYEERLLNVMAEILLMKTGGRSEEMPRHAKRTKLVNQCWDFAQQQKDRNLTIEDLCAETKASSRVLRYAFREMTGHSPALFLRNHRLHRARRMLLEGAPAVKEVAYSCGFTEMGRFSVYYRELFGESPSATLRRKRATQKRKRLGR